MVDARKRLLGEEHLDTISDMKNLAQMYYKLAKYADAERLQVHVEDARRRLFGEHHPKTILILSNCSGTQEIRKKMCRCGVWTK